MRFTRLSLDRLGLASVAVLQIFHLSCGGENPVAPRLTPTVGAGPAVAATPSGGVSAQNDPPTMVLRTTPPVDPERGAVSGPSPLTVLFNVCRSSDPDEGDTLNHQFHFGDSGRPAFNPDGSFNADFDHFCRAEHTYRSPGTYTATVSVTDKHLEDQGRDVSALARRTETVTIVVSRPARGTLTIAKGGTGTGTVTGNGISCGATCSATLLLGSEVSLSAAAGAGSVFSGWSLPSCGSNNACAFTLTGSTTVTAIFDLSSTAPPPSPGPPPPPGLATLTVGKSGIGTVTGSGIDCGATCSVSLAAGSQVNLSAVAGEGWSFGNWSVPACGTNASCSFTLAGDVTVTATFLQLQPEMTTLSVTKPGTGNGTVQGNGIDCGVVCAVSLPVGTEVTLAAASSLGSAFAGWSVPACGASDTCTFTVTGLTGVTATFERTGTLVVRNAASGISQVLTGLQVVRSPSGEPLGVAPVAPADSLSIPGLATGDYSAVNGVLSGLGCPAVAFTLSPGSTASLRYEIFTPTLGRPRCTVALE